MASSISYLLMAIIVLTKHPVYLKPATVITKELDSREIIVKCFQDYGDQTQSKTHQDSKISQSAYLDRILKDKKKLATKTKSVKLLNSLGMNQEKLSRLKKRDTNWIRAFHSSTETTKSNRNCSVSVTSVSSNMADGNTYFFKNSHFWRISKNYKMDDGYPRNITQKWRGIPETFDECFLWGANWRSYFFKENLYYKYDYGKNEVVDGYPKLISEGWIGVPDNIDAAFTDRNQRSFFFKGDLVYLYDDSRNHVAFGYPLKIKHVFPGVPDAIDTAFRYYFDGKVYFFKNLNYYIWNGMQNKAEGPFAITDGWSNMCIT